jgi:hypothetical protein
MATQATRSWLPLTFGVLFLVGMGAVTIRYLFQARVVNDELIADHIEQLKDIFRRIHVRCKITGFRNAKDQIDFLNVISFAGSVVGSMNVLEPQNWEGPYLSENLTMQGKEYQLIQTKKGYYIVPGDGVRLANGKIIGKTLLISPDSDIEPMLHDPQALLSSNRSLGTFIETYQYPHPVSSVSSIPLEEIETLD